VHDRPVFEVVVQLAAVLTAMPIVTLLGFAVWQAVLLYPFSQLHAQLLTLVARDLRRTLEEPGDAVLARDEPAKRRDAIATIERALHARDEAADDARRADSEQLVGRLLCAVDAPPIATAALQARAARHVERCERRIAGWLRRSDPLAIVRWYPVRLAGQQVRLAARALGDVGTSMASALLTPAGRHMTNGAIAGVIVGVVVWSAGTGYQGRFFDYIGIGGSLGGFAGLGATVALVVRTVRDQYREAVGSHVVKWPSCAALCVFEALQLLIFFGAVGR
jgi:hypothetical protein